MIDLKGKVALITGGSRGIGAASALRFAEAGADVVVNFVQAEADGNRVAGKCRELGARAIAVQADVSTFDEVERLFRVSVESFGKVDILVANAGVWKGGAIDELSPAAYRETIEINLTGVFASCRQAAMLMKKQHGGNIITVSSTAGQRGEPLHSHYAASKGAVISLTKALATELGPYGIRVNCVAPGWVETDMSADFLKIPSEIHKINAGIPLGRVASADDIAGPILFLASDLSGHITGEVLNVNGGSVLCG
ncbi:MAG TPA: 3-oxoacyl-ACP reductase family protein [Blastocatellia bacterium]|nr:3-oxoacyl-ACP reductase family protein [Blastocatellia bacterium]